MKQVKHFFIWAAVIATLTSCRKFLEAKPSQNLAVPSTLTDLQALLDNIDRLNINHPLLALVSADEYYLRKQDWDGLDAAGRMAYIWHEDIYAGSNTNDWGYAYIPVFITNEVLEKISVISPSPGEQQVYNNIKGSALMFRANSFLQAAAIWAKAYDKTSAVTDPGIPLRLTPDFNTPSQRASVQETFGRILADLKTAAELLPETPQHSMRPSRRAAWGLLARTYLYMREYDSCSKYAALAFQSGGGLLDFNSLNPSLAYPFSRFNSEVIFHGRCVFSYSTPFYSYARVDSLLINAYHPDDLRKSLFYKDNPDGSYFFRGSFDNSFYFFNGVSLSEIYLLHAECLARKGNHTEAINVLNALLVKRWKTGLFTPLQAADPAEALGLVLEERKKELAFRNLRWMDIKRLNKEGKNIVPKRVLGNEIVELSPNENRYALPIPPDIISLTSMQQNPR